MNGSRSLIERIENIKESLFILILFITSFIFRLPTLFNDFYDVDELAAIVQTKEYFAGFTPGVDFKESKLPLYHAIFKFSYDLNALYGWVIVHLITILFVFLTALSVYYIGRTVRDRKTGIIASLLYAVLISSFNRHFMATNGEIIYNLPVTAGLLFLLLAVKVRSWSVRAVCSVMTGLSMYAAMNVKVHGAILLIFAIFLFSVYLPYYRSSLKRLVILYSSLFAVLLTAAVFDFYITKKFAPGLAGKLWEFIFYAVFGRSSNPLNLIAIYSYRQLTIGLWHAVLWIPAAVYIYGFIKNRFRKDTVEESVVAMFAFITFLMVFAGGARLYYHYFMTSYPSLCVIAAIALLSADVPAVKKLLKNITAAVLIPGLFFLCWNFKDIYIKYCNPGLFYNEHPATFWFRAVVVSSMNDYLLPDSIYRDTVEYIRTRSSPSDTIFVWGDGPHLYYFSDRRIAIHHVWPKGSAIRMEQAYRSGKPEAIAEAEAEQAAYIATMERKKPALFIDTSPKGLIRGVTDLGSFAKFPYNVPPVIRKYLDGHYRLEASVDDYKIYRRVR